MESAGGIGGLVAIVEENPAGQVLRTLLPAQDGLGNVTAVFDQADGRVVARYDSGPYGEPLGESGEADACPFRWQTKWYDRETEQYYFGYRYYDPRFGRWLSRDPLGEDGGFNLYSMCGNDPVNRHDPLGLADEHIIDSSFNGGEMRGVIRRLAEAVEHQVGYGTTSPRVERLIAGKPATEETAQKFLNESALWWAENMAEQQRRNGVTAWYDVWSGADCTEKKAAIQSCIADRFAIMLASREGFFANGAVYGMYRNGDFVDRMQMMHLPPDVEAWASGSSVGLGKGFHVGEIESVASIGRSTFVARTPPEGGIVRPQIVPKAVNPRLLSKLDAFKGYTARGGQMNLAQWHRTTILRYGGDGGVYNSGFGEWFRQTSGKVHGNSLLAMGPHDVYVIRETTTGRVLHFGETGRGYLTRFEEHFGYFSELGIDVRVELLRTVEGKAAARAFEMRYINTYLKFFGERPLFNPVSR